MATNFPITDNTYDRDVIVIHDKLHCLLVINDFFSNLCLNLEKSRCSSKCKFCPLTVTDTYKTTLDFVKHLKNKHQSIYDEWKKNNDRCTKHKNQSKLNHIFSPDRRKCATIFCCC
ncbi:hypothetical protein I4U23_016264 [Adineta vaga]|nr:hypothetical protein I4U23_016264 [Adineta vaga]